MNLAELGSENLRTMIYIIQSYILLSPESFLASCGDVISQGLQVSICTSLMLSVLK
jgi:hypothetical protein